ncbi:hypothetical protein NQ317_007109 [Molorchus minor]|uniref:Transposase n=1 Tax=Molorchus minor TaxID=1323400 RepID=A0ABQ9JYX4_9CUCU|nr:hypothetical protein NQ317_007109 [Molorchus minor]
MENYIFGQMPRKYQRKTEKGKWTAEQLRNAITEISNGCSIRSAGKEHGIPESTIRKKLKLSEEERYQPMCLGGVVTFTMRQEQELADHVIKLAKMFHGLNPIQLRKLAYQYAEANNVCHKFNKERKLAGKDWYYNFMERHPNITLRKPEATSVNRIKAFNQESVKLFFSNLELVYDKYKFTPDNIFNVDETGITVVQKPVKCLAPKGLKQLGYKTSAEREKNVTVICCCNAIGRYIAPMFIFPRKRMTDLLSKNGPSGALFSCSLSGWSNENLCMDWLQHFSQSVKPTVMSPVLVILDNHSSHISLSIYEFCKSTGIVLLTLPPHTSHRMQPLDLTFFGPLKSAYNQECDLFLRSHERITTYDLAEIFNKAFIKVGTMEKAISGFRSAGIYPFQPDKFTLEDFAPASQFQPVNDENTLTDITNKNLSSKPNDACVVSNTESQQPSTSNTSESAFQQTSKMQNLVTESLASIISEQASKSKSDRNSPSETTNRLKGKHVTAETLSPIPCTSSTSKYQRKNKQKSIILTATPNKDELEEAEKKKQARQKEVDRRNSDSEVESIDSVSMLCDDDECDDYPDVDENQCLVCGELPTKSESWYRCTVCSNWAHALCTGYDSPENYICDHCD